MPDRVEAFAWDGRGTIPLLSTLDATRLAQVASLAAGATRESNPIECTGYRRYRLKIVQLTGAGPTAVTIRDLPFAPVTANSWENIVLAAAMATGVRTVFNFGEGTVNMPNFCGPFFALSLTNNGANAATYEIELWMQG